MHNNQRLLLIYFFLFFHFHRQNRNLDMNNTLSTLNLLSFIPFRSIYTEIYSFTWQPKYNINVKCDMDHSIIWLIIFPSFPFIPSVWFSSQKKKTTTTTEFVFHLVFFNQNNNNRLLLQLDALVITLKPTESIRYRNTVVWLCFFFFFCHSNSFCFYALTQFFYFFSSSCVLHIQWGPSVVGFVCWQLEKKNKYNFRYLMFVFFAVSYGAFICFLVVEPFQLFCFMHELWFIAMLYAMVLNGSQSYIAIH